MLDVLAGSDAVRAMVDVVSTDLAGIVPPLELVPAPLGRRPLFALAEPATSLAATATAPRPTALPTAAVPLAEKTAISTTLYPIPTGSVAIHQAFVSLGDVSIAVMRRSVPEYLTFVQSLAEAAAESVLEDAVCVDIGASVATVALDPWAAYATAAAYGGPVLALTAASELATVYADFGPGGLIATGQVVVVPVATAAFKMLAVAQSNLTVQLAGPERLESFDAARLGYDSALIWSARAFIGFVGAAAKVS
jgi:hypothetical protein